MPRVLSRVVVADPYLSTFKLSVLPWPLGLR